MKNRPKQRVAIKIVSLNFKSVAAICVHNNKKTWSKLIKHWKFLDEYGNNVLHH